MVAARLRETRAASQAAQAAPGAADPEDSEDLEVDHLEVRVEDHRVEHHQAEAQAEDHRVEDRRMEVQVAGRFHRRAVGRRGQGVQAGREVLVDPEVREALVAQVDQVVQVVPGAQHHPGRCLTLGGIR